MDKIQDKRDWHFTVVENAILFSTKLTAYEKVTYAILCAYANSKTRECYPSIRTIAESSGISDNTVRKAIKGLEEKGLITIEYRKIGDMNNSNLYTIVNIPQWIMDEYEAIKACSTSPDEVGTSSPEVGTSPNEVGVPHEMNQGTSPDEVGTSPREGELEPYNKNQLTRDSSSCSSNDLIEVVNQYEKSGFGLPGQNMIDYLKSDVEKYGKARVLEALAESDRRGKHRLDYVEGILENWHSDGKGDGKDGGSRSSDKQNKKKFKKDWSNFMFKGDRGDGSG